jgi:cob(I)alamin adenosyltransferase
MSIYTKKGDGGETGLYSSEKGKVVRVSKDALRIEAIGSTDEANSFLGICLSLDKGEIFKNKIVKIQTKLFKIGAILAGAKLNITSYDTKSLEKEIDEMDKELPKLTHFILPGGSELAAHLFTARTFIRRAERRIVLLAKEEMVPASVLVFVNRLSDYIYTLARYVNYKDKIKEVIWKK